MKKLGIITYHRVRNFGSVLQAFGLYKYLENQGYNTEIIQYEPEGHRTRKEFFGVPNTSLIKKVIYLLASFPMRTKLHFIYKKFRKKHLKMSDHIYFSKHDFIEKKCKYDVYITGSDQVWNSRYNALNDTIGYAYYFDFTEDEEKRIGYSVSFGEESLDMSANPKISQLVNRYSHIGVREKSGLAKLESLGFNHAVHTIDPTLLLTKNDWAELFEDTKIKEPYLLIYDPQRADSEKFKEYALYIAKRYGLKIVKISKEYIKPAWVDIVIYPSVNQWLTLVNNADYVLTNSFHGIAFCVNFQKEFCCIRANSANNRVTEFLDFMNLNDRFVTTIEECENNLSKKIDYSDVSERISKLRNESCEYLKTAIGD